MPLVYIAIGSNQGNRGRHIEKAMVLIQDIPNTTVLRTSPLYESQAVTVAGVPSRSQHPYLNGVVALATGLAPATLLSQLQAIESVLGRPKARAKWTERPIDLDILSYGHTVFATARLVIPHPEIPKRLFVLLPLRDIAPAWRHPATGRSLDDLIRVCQDRHAITIKKC
jgi:2-amino-4-hydroxy-6-hydroxymethyldihydropteridine diphosphokinase